MELVGWDLLGLSLLYLAAIALAGGLLAYGVAGLGSIGIAAGIVAGEDVSEATRQHQAMMIGAVVGPMVGLQPPS